MVLFFGLDFLGLFAFTAIVIESGLIRSEQRTQQNTADAAALAGAQGLFVSEAQGITDAQTWALANVPDLAQFSANVFNDGGGISVTVGRDADGVFTGHLSFGEPRVQATAVARIAGGRLPGPGVFCIGVEHPDYSDAEAFQSLPGNDPANFLTIPPDEYYSRLRLGAGDALSNAGYIDIDFAPSGENIRDCFAEGSKGALQPDEESETGITTGQARQGLQIRLENAMARGDCFSWPQVRASIVEARANPQQPWRCSPLVNQATSIVLLPIFNEQFLDGSGNQLITVFTPGDAQPYILGFYWIDAVRTFVDITSNNWKFIVSGGQGQAEIDGVFLIDHPVNLSAPPDDSSVIGGIVDCDFQLSTQCFIQLVG